MDLFLKKSVAKFSCRSKRFAKLASDVNKHLHCLGKRAQSQEASRQDQNSLIKNISVSGKDWESTVNNIWVVRKGCTNLCAPTLVNLTNTNQSRSIFQQ